MPVRSFFQLNVGRAYRLVAHGNRLERARNYLAWQRQRVQIESVRKQRARRAARCLENRRLLERELREQRVRLESHPTTLTLDPASVCNLRCPFCPTGAGFGTFERTIMTPERFSAITSHLRCDLIQRVELYNWGEPLLNPHIFDFIRFFSERQAEIELSSNFSHREYDDSFLDELVGSGLTTLVVSIDGASQEAYGKYRIRGDFERIIRNLKRLAAVKRALGSEHPRVVYKMLLNRFNQHQVADAARLADECGASFLLNERFWCPDFERDRWVATSEPSSASEVAEPGPPEVPPGRVQGYSTAAQEVISTYCRQLWDSVIVTATGDVHPCCLSFDDHHAIGNLANEDIETIRNNDRAVALRRYVTDPLAAAPLFTNACELCTSRWCVTHGSKAADQPPATISGLTVLS